MKNYLFPLSVVLMFTLSFTSCSSDDGPTATAPEVTSDTTPQNAVTTYTTVEINGSVSSSAESEITSRGVVWSTNQNPTIADNATTESTNDFTSTIENLTANTTYYFSVYATNSVGTSYGPPIPLSTSALDDSTWDFTISLDNTNPNNTWHADVTFNADGTTVYDEPSSPGTYTTYGVWTLTGNTLVYEMDPSFNGEYVFTGTLNGNTMDGTFIFSSYPNPTWSAIKY